MQRRPEETKAAALRLVEQGLSRAEIGPRLGVSAGWVSRLAAANGLGFSEPQVERANRVRLLGLQSRRLDQAEQIHLTLDAAVALIQGQIMTDPGSPRDIFDRAGLSVILLRRTGISWPSTV